MATTILVPRGDRIATVVRRVVRARVVPLSFKGRQVRLRYIVRTQARPCRANGRRVVGDEVVMVATTFLVSFRPVANRFVRVLTCMKTTAIVLQLRVTFRLVRVRTVYRCDLEVVVRRVNRYNRDLYEYGQPSDPVPFALACTVHTRLEVATLNDNGSMEYKGAFLIRRFLPYRDMFKEDVQRVRVPESVTSDLTCLNKHVSARHFGRVVIYIPRLVLCRYFGKVNFRSVFRNRTLVSYRSTSGERYFNVTVRVAISDKANVLLAATSTSKFFRAVLRVSLPVGSVKRTIYLFPANVFHFRVLCRVRRGLLISVSRMASRCHVHVPQTGLNRFNRQTSFIAPVPDVSGLVRMFQVARPTTLVGVVASNADCRVMFVNVQAICRGFNRAVTRQDFLSILTRHPPAVVVRFLRILLETLRGEGIFFRPLEYANVKGDLNCVLVLRTIRVVRVKLRVLVFRRDHANVLVDEDHLGINCAVNTRKFLLAHVQRGTVPIHQNVRHEVDPLHSNPRRRSLSNQGKHGRRALPRFLSVRVSGCRTINGEGLRFCLVHLTQFVLRRVAGPHASFNARGSVKDRFRAKANGTIFVRGFCLRGSFVILFHRRFRECFRFFYDECLALRANVVRWILILRRRPFSVR